MLTATYKPSLSGAGPRYCPETQFIGNGTPYMNEIEWNVIELNGIEWEFQLPSPKHGIQRWHPSIKWERS